MNNLSGEESPMPPNSRNGDHVSGFVNGNGVVPGGHLTSELRNLVSILGRQSDNGISLEQLLTGNSPSRNSITPTQTLSHPFPTTPNSSKSTSWTGGRKRGRPTEAEESAKRRRGSYSTRQSGEKGHSKGLRHFSQRVCEKVRLKGNTTYNEVADELVKELSETERKSHGSNEMPIDHKNIRRRVYDALNVLMAMNIISKEKKDIRWIGLPTNSVQECQHVEEELAQTEQRIQSKRSKVEELMVQILLYKNLMKRNRDRMSDLAAPAQNSAIGLPFIIVNTNKSTTIDCSISSDKSEYVFSFDNAFELHNDIDVLKKMGLDCGLHSGTCSADNLKHAKSLLPKAFGDVLDEIATAKNLPTVSDSLPHTPIAIHPPSSMTSTPNTTLSPSLTPFTTPTASPHSAAMAVLAQTSSTLQHSPQASSPLSHTSPGRLTPILVPNNAKSSNFFSGLSFSQASSSLIANSIRGKTVVPIAAKQTSRSPVSTAKTVLHHRCPSIHPESASPLIKSSFADTESMLSKSPNAKIVTCSKVSNNEQLHSILQQLQQNPNISKLLSAANSHSNGNEAPS